MNKSSKKRRQLLIRTAVYSLMTISVIVLVALLMLAVLGYSFNQKDGKLEQGGLLQFGSTPSGAIVTLDELVLGQRTTTKSTVSTGSHSVSFDRPNYRTWKKTIYINPGQIGWVNYARMIPTTINPETVRTFESVSGALESPGRKWMLIQPAANQPSFELTNIESDTVRYTTITLPATSYTAPAAGAASNFSIESWSQDDNAVLLKHTFNDNQVEWILLDRDNPENSQNLNTSFGVQPSKVEFAGSGERLLYVQTDDIVRRINLNDQTLSRPLASNVESFSEYDDKTIVFVSRPNEAGKRTVGYATIDVAQPQTIREFPADGQPLLAGMKSYFNKKYITIVHGETMTIEYGTLPTPNEKAELKTYATQKIPAGTIRLVVTDNGRFASMQLPDGFATYDLELKKYDKTTWTNQSQLQSPIRWLDGYVIWSSNGGQLRIYDFDGANQQTLMPVVEGLGVSLSPNDKYLYGINKTDKGFTLNRIQLVL